MLLHAEPVFPGASGKPPKAALTRIPRISLGKEAAVDGIPRIRRMLWLLLGGSLLLKILLVLLHGAAYDYHSDDRGYLESARILLETGRFTYNDPSRPTAFITPALPGFLAAVMTVTGPGLVLEQTVRILQAVMVTGALWLLYRIGLRMVSSKASLLAVALCCLYPPLWLVSNFIFTEALFTLFVLLLLYMALLAEERPTWSRALLFGLVWAAAVYVRPTIALWPGLLFLLLLYRRNIPWPRLIRSGLVTAAVFVLCLLPWWVRNYEVSGGEFIPLTRASGNPLLLGTYPWTVPSFFLRSSGLGTPPTTCGLMTRSTGSELWNGLRKDSPIRSGPTQAGIPSGNFFCSGAMCSIGCRFRGSSRRRHPVPLRDSPPRLYWHVESPPSSGGAGYSAPAWLHEPASYDLFGPFPLFRAVDAAGRTFRRFLSAVPKAPQETGSCLSSFLKKPGCPPLACAIIEGALSVRTERTKGDFILSAMTKLYMTGLAAATAAVLYAITRVQNWGILCILVLLAALWGTRKDAKPISWIQFMPAGFITLLAFFVIYTYANPLWEKVVGWQTSSVHHIVNWNEWFNSIPLNDAAFLRVWQPSWLTKYMQWVYSYGFTLTYWICVIRAFFTKDVRKLGQYSLAGYLLQVPLILPFYNTILLQEVWHVQGTPDLLERGLTGDDVFLTVINCFPSMHTSIAFAAILLAFREKAAGTAG
ncbi:glycosyltransferase family 39 protein [Paenibacillus sp. CC-CFT747]|nr:glycosyltransferase family 39 protein [Paenibacillus sp. CC-CFT747]